MKLKHELFKPDFYAYARLAEIVRKLIGYNISDE